MIAPGVRATRRENLAIDGMAVQRTGRRATVGALAALGIYVALTVGMTWPLARAPGSLLYGNPDVYGNTWAICWVADRGFRDPAHLFDANMYFPHRKSLAYAESLVPQALQAWPVRALGGSAALAYNVVFFATFPLSGLGALLLARELGASGKGAFVAGLGFAFCAYRWDHAVHVQSLSTAGLPFALLFLRRGLRRGSFRDVAGLAAATWVQLLSSGYYAFLLGIAILVALVFEIRAADVAEPRAARRLLRVGAGLLLALAAAAPVFLQHREVMRRHGFARKALEAWPWSATLASYLDPGPYSLMPHTRALRHALEAREPLFPGSLVLGFAAWGAWTLRRDRGARLAAGWALAGIVLSFGPEWRLFGLALPGPFTLLRVLPGGDLLRTPSRFGILGVLGLDLLAGLAFTAAVEKLSRGRRGRARAFGFAFGIFMTLEAWPAGLARVVKQAPPAPPAVGWLAQAPPGAVLELPWKEFGEGALYVYWSTGHWHPLVNGYGSFDPPGNFAAGLIGQRWPSGYSSRVFRSLGIRYVVVHVDRLDGDARARIEGTSELPPGVEAVYTEGSDRVYAIDPAGPELREGEPMPDFGPEAKAGPRAERYRSGSTDDLSTELLENGRGRGVGRYRSPRVQEIQGHPER